MIWLCILAIGGLSAPPTELGFDPFYGKWAVVRGIPVLAAQEVSDAAVLEAARLAGRMLAEVDPAVVRAMAESDLRIAVIGRDQQTTDIPEYSRLNELYPETDWNARTRGLGATEAIPVVSAAEENLLSEQEDRYRGECIFVHEFAHTVLDFGVEKVRPEFDTLLKSAYADAVRNGLWQDTYAASNHDEYWAEGVQSYFNQNRCAVPSNGIHNHVATRDALRAYDPALFKLIQSVFGESAPIQKKSFKL